MARRFVDLSIYLDTSSRLRMWPLSLSGSGSRHARSRDLRALRLPKPYDLVTCQ